MNKLIIVLIFFVIISPKVWGNDFINDPFQRKVTFEFNLDQSDNKFGIYLDDPKFTRPGEEPKKKMMLGYKFSDNVLMKVRGKLKKDKITQKYQVQAGIVFVVKF